MNRGVITISESGTVSMPTDTVWMTMQEIADMYNVFGCYVRKAVKAVFKDGILKEQGVRLLLSRCGHIYLQQNWKSSRGARIEFRVAKFLGIQIWFQSNPGEENLYSENFCDVMKCK